MQASVSIVCVRFQVALSLNPLKQSVNYSDVHVTVHRDKFL